MIFWLALKFWTEKHPIGQILFDIPIIILKTVAAFLITWYLIRKYIVEEKRYILFLILSTLGFIITGFVDLLRDYFGRGLGWSDLPDPSYILVHSYYYSAADLAVPFVIVVAKKYFENQTKLAQVSEQEKEAQLKLLHAQLSPHFLFNNLNTVDALIDTNPKQAKNYISRLSSIYHYLIKNKDNDVVTLQEELEMAKYYIYLIEIRFGMSYQFKFSNTIEPALQSNTYYMPTASLQAIIENVVKHNKVINNQEIITTISIDANQLIITNNKGNNDVNDSIGTGLKNLKNRYNLLFNKCIDIENTESHFSIKLPLEQIVL